MVECEYQQTIYIMKKLRVLIDTWWNVNNILLIIEQMNALVLIDTWWNVNDETEYDLYYMKGVLIDTWWNVNIIMELLRHSKSPF